MRKIIFMLVVATIMGVVEASTPVMPKFPEKYETWINNQHSEACDIEFDFHNYETSFTEQVCGFNKNYYGSWYGYKISKHIVSHRDLFNTSVSFVLKFIDTPSGITKKNLRDSIKTFRLLYDDEILELKDLLCFTDCRLEKTWYSIDFLGYLDKETFLKLSQSEKLLLQFEIDSTVLKFDLKIPKVYDDTFK